MDTGYFCSPQMLTHSQQLVRFVIEQYRDELLSALQGTFDEHKIAAGREAVASDLLNILHRYASFVQLFQVAPFTVIY